MRWAWRVARTGARKGAYRAVVGKRETNRPLGRPRHSWEDNIKVNFQYVGWRDMDCTDLDKERDRYKAFVNAVMNLRVPLNAGNFLTT
jgi:hypothetical protein